MKYDSLILRLQPFLSQHSIRAVLTLLIEKNYVVGLMKRGGPKRRGLGLVRSLYARVPIVPIPLDIPAQTDEANVVTR